MSEDRRIAIKSTYGYRLLRPEAVIVSHKPFPSWRVPNTDARPQRLTRT